MLPNTLTRPAYSNLHRIRMKKALKLFKAFVVKRASSTTGVTPSSKISISAFSISILQLIFYRYIDIANINDSSSYV